jgi:hypothetical protein
VGTGDNEENMLQICWKMLVPGPCVLDVGRKISWVRGTIKVISRQYRGKCQCHGVCVLDVGGEDFLGTRDNE